MTRPVYIDHDGGDEDPSCELNRWIDSDPIAALFHFVRAGGGTMTLHGEPIDEPELRAAAEVSFVQRLTAAVTEDTARPGTTIEVRGG